MTWECPHLSNGICTINGIECRPGRGQCVLKGKVKITNIDRSRFLYRRKGKKEKITKKK